MAILEEKTIELGDGLLVDVHPEEETVQFRIGDEKVLVKKVDLWAACFAIADPKTQEALLPIRQTLMTTFARIHTVKLKRDMKKGQTLTIRCRINVPQIVEEGLAGSLTERKSKFL